MQTISSNTWEDKDDAELTEYDEFQTRCRIKTIQQDEIQDAFPIPVLKRHNNNTSAYITDTKPLIATETWPIVVEPAIIAKMIELCCFPKQQTTSYSIMPPRLNTTDTWPMVVELDRVAKMAVFFKPREPIYESVPKKTPVNLTPDTWPAVVEPDRIALLMSYFKKK